MSATQRRGKLSRAIQGEIANLLQSETSDPRLQGVCVTEVVLSKDLKEATIFYLGGQSEKETPKAFQKAGPFLRRRLSQRLTLRSVPELQFERDSHTESVPRLMALLDAVKMGDPL